ncbi:MAG: DUF1223 domain-containing protein [Bacteroidetes bacterium]|nr:DUF1223 domain-containing protein [Bacteroidota bacterium]
MKQLFLAIVLLGFSLNIYAQNPVAVIELFTSQGCSSCPSADKLLDQTISEAKKDGRNIIALSFHVDYWNRLGWADPFSDKAYSQRQSDYISTMHLRSAYTPQMVVNGEYEFVGSNNKDLKSALEKALNTEPIASFKTLKAIIKGNNAPHIKYELEGDFEGCNINFALVSLNEITSVKRGENGGRELKNENVVRQFITIPAKANGELNFENTPMPASENMAIVSYIQRDNDLSIIGGAYAELNIN